jgi:uncharacterized protein YndB with AHSA1/START domain
MTESTYEVRISRYFDAAPDLVFRAFTDADQLAQWFGPLVFVVPRDTVEADVRTGGHWKMVMVGKDDPEWRAPITASFTEVVENRLIVGYETAEGVPGIEDGTRMSLSIELIPEGDGTRLELRQGPFPEATREMSEVGWSQSFHKLDALLATPAKFRNSPGKDATP